jgi:hypothetical protein
LSISFSATSRAATVLNIVSAPLVRSLQRLRALADRAHDVAEVLHDVADLLALDADR